jgi:predicted O-linked N-acetylglucosamine transferase (SPINDLY family)
LRNDAATVSTNLERALTAQLAGDLDAADAAYRGLLPSEAVDALHGLGLVAQQRGDFGTALGWIEAAHRLAASARSAHNLAVVLARLGRSAEAISRTREAIAFDAAYVPARFGLATLLTASGAARDAAGVLIDFADYALRAGDAAVAREATQRVAALGADHPSLLWLANLMQLAGFGDDAQAVLAIRLRRAPNDIGARLTRAVSHLTRVHADEAEIERRRAQYAAELAEAAVLTEHARPVDLAEGADSIGLAQPFLLAYHARNDVDLQRTYGGMIARLAAARFGPAAMPAPPRQGERIRVGIASAHLHLHSVSKTHGGWLEHLDRTRFEVFGYQFSDAADATSVRLAACCDRFVRGVADAAAWRARILADAPHALIYFDIGMEQTAVRLASLRLAPVQCTTWGHPVTSGLPTVDYYLSAEAMEPPDGDAHYTERLVRLPNLGICYTAPPFDGTRAERTALGLREDAVVYLCCQSLYKYLPRFDNVWPRIAARVPAAQFLFIAANHGSGDAVFQSRLQRAFAGAGLDWARHCSFVPRVAHEAFAPLLRAGDVYLDSIGWSGCNSTLEAVACGLPVVTTPTALMRGRHSAAILSCMGLQDCIAPDVDAYIEHAVRLADSSRRAAFAAALHLRRSRVFADLAPVRALEEFIALSVRRVTRPLGTSRPVARASG